MPSTDLANKQLETEASSALAQASALAIVDSATYHQAGEMLQGVKGLSKRILEWFKPMKQDAEKAHKTIVAREKEQLQPLATAENTIKQKMLTYQREEERKRQAEQDRIQREIDERARVEREKFEREAARQQAIKDDADRKAAEAARLAQEAQNEEDRKILLKEAAKRERQASAAAVKVEAKQQQAAAVVSPVVTVPPTITQAEGTGTRRNWKAEVVDFDKFFDYCLASKRFDLLAVNDKALQAYAKAMQERSVLPGVKFTQTETLTARSK